MHLIDCYISGLQQAFVSEEQMQALEMAIIAQKEDLRQPTAERKSAQLRQDTCNPVQMAMQEQDEQLLHVKGEFEMASSLTVNHLTGIVSHSYTLLFRRKTFSVQSKSLRTQVLRKLNKINQALLEYFFVLSLTSGSVFLKKFSGCRSQQLFDPKELAAQNARAVAVMSVYLSHILKASNSEHLLEPNVRAHHPELVSLIDLMESPEGVSYPGERIQEGYEDQIPEDIEIQSAAPLPNPSRSGNNILREIHLYGANKIKWPLFDYGGFSMVFKDQVQFEIVASEGNSEHFEQSYSKKKAQRAQCLRKGTLIRKEPIKGYEHKCRREREVLRLLKDYSCPHILSFYFTKQDERFRTSIFSEYCQFKSFNYYVYYFSLSVSLVSKLRILLEAMMGLLFLKNIGVCHLDIKPDNLLVTKGLRCKLGDFGQAYHPSLQNYRVTGYTIPYAPPELFDTRNFNSQMDIFSFGMVLLEVLCEQCPVQSKKPNSKAAVSKAYRSRNYLHLVRVQPEKIHKMGHWQVIDILYILGIKCIQPVPSDRLSHEKIITVLRSLINFLEQL